MPRCCSSCETSASPAAVARVLDWVSAAIPAGADRDRRPLGQRQVDPAAAAEPACRPGSRRRSPTAASRSRATTRWRCAARSRWSRSCRRCWRGRSSRTSPTPPASPARSSTPPRCLRLAGLEPDYAGRDVAKLSVGEQQRAMLGRALAQQPEVLLLDEPTSALDHAARDAIEAALAELRRELEISIVLVTHDPEQARRLSDWVVRLEAGPRRRLRRPRGGAGVSSSRTAALEHLDPRLRRPGRRLARPGRPRGGDLLLVEGRPRARHRHRRRPLARPADPDRLRDQADLRGRHALARLRPAWR